MAGLLTNLDAELARLERDTRRPESEAAAREMTPDRSHARLESGRRHDADATRILAYRSALTAIREGVGNGRFILGCGALMAPSVGNPRPPRPPSLGQRPASTVSSAVGDGTGGDEREPWAPGRGATFLLQVPLAMDEPLDKLA